MSIPARRTIAVLVAIASPSLAACVTESNRCTPGFKYAPQYDACLQEGVDADGGIASDGADTVNANDALADAAPVTDAGGGDSGLGNACNASSDCTGRASFCLKDPTADPTDPGICSIPGCTAADCTSGYSCCDCTAAVLASLTAWPAAVCAPSANTSTLTAVGCKCL
jgi:hypothetical protein